MFCAGGQGAAKRVEANAVAPSFFGKNKHVRNMRGNPFIYNGVLSRFRSGVCGFSVTLLVSEGEKDVQDRILSNVGLNGFGVSDGVKRIS